MSEHRPGVRDPVEEAYAALEERAGSLLDGTGRALRIRDFRWALERAGLLEASLCPPGAEANSADQGSDAGLLSGEPERKDPDERQREFLAAHEERMGRVDEALAEARERGELDSLRVPGFDFDVPIRINPGDAHRGIVRYEGFNNRPVIYLREWDQRALLHETLHVLFSSWRHSHRRERHLDSEAEERFVRHLTHLHELGWRLSLSAASPTGTGPE